jgi:biotin carboxyl carrier protein
MTETYLVKIDGRPYTVALDDEGSGRWRAVVNGRARRVDARAVEGGAWSIVDVEGDGESDGESGGEDAQMTARLVRVDGAPPKLSVEVSHPDGEPRGCLVELGDGRAAAGPPREDDGARAGGAPAAVTLRAPIPGKLVKVLVKAGDPVKAGQTLLVLEAMKMENELRAPRAGVVSLLHVAEGTAVETGQDLVTLG